MANAGRARPSAPAKTSVRNAPTSKASASTHAPSTDAAASIAGIQAGAIDDAAQRSVLDLQATIGNRAVQRVLDGEGGDGGGSSTIFMDPSGVGHKEPDKSKAPSVFFMDSSGVAHKEPDKSKAPPVLFMDPSGVGHKAPDKAPPTPKTFFMSPTGVAFDALPNRQAEQARAAVAERVSQAKPRAETVTKAIADWGAGLVTADAAKVAAEAARDRGVAVWDVEAPDAGTVAARSAAEAAAEVPKAKKTSDDAAATLANVKAQAAWLKSKQALSASTALQYAGDRPKWAKGANAATKLVLGELDVNVPLLKKTVDDAVALAANIDATIAALKAAADAAAAAATFASKPFVLNGGPYVINGMLQQKLNHVRPDGTGRLKVLGFFDAATRDRLRAFQATAGVPVTGVADVATWNALNTAAPTVVKHGELEVEAKGGAEPSTPVGGKIHPDLGLGSTGSGVKELQQRLNNFLADPLVAGMKKPPYKPLTIDGIFGLKTRAAVQAFKKAKGIGASATVDKPTWDEIDKISGAVTQGQRTFQYLQYVEGMLTGADAKYNWAVVGQTLQITVKINFTGASSHPRVTQWLQDIKDVWNSFKAREVGAGGINPPREYDIEFVPVKASGGHPVKVGKPTKKNPNPRSDAANWYVNDSRRGLAPHEFGHLIGLQDEYNRPEEEYVKATGLETRIGSNSSSTGTGPKEIAKQLHDVVVANAGETGAKMSEALAAKVTEHGLQPGMFSRRVAEWYQVEYGFDGAPNMSQYIAKVSKRDWTGDLTTATEPFVESNSSIMGTMESTGDRNLDLNTVADHEHPVQPRHVRTFADLLSLAVPGVVFAPVRR